MSFVTSLHTNAPSRRTVRRAALASVVALSTLVVAALGVARAQSAHAAHATATPTPGGAAGTRRCTCS